MAIRSPPDPSGGGQCFALLRMRIATSGFALLAMTWKLGAGPSILAVPLSKLGGGGNAARPTVRFPYAERILATGRAVLLDSRLAQPIRPELAPALPVGRFYSTAVK